MQDLVEGVVELVVGDVGAERRVVIVGIGDVQQPCEQLVLPHLFFFSASERADGERRGRALTWGAPEDASRRDPSDVALPTRSSPRRSPSACAEKLVKYIYIYIRALAWGPVRGATRRAMARHGTARQDWVRRGAARRSVALCAVAWARHSRAWRCTCGHVRAACAHRLSDLPLRQLHRDKVSAHRGSVLTERAAVSRADVGPTSAAAWSAMKAAAIVDLCARSDTCTAPDVDQSDGAGTKGGSGDVGHFLGPLCASP